ncbi:MAG: ATP-dependent Clp protease proteolytic subunit [Candidatus Cloacimonadota bacterium]|nr:ATP-dependent Clp protease proteolytic subunit [Candidatus Cloacimonadota bacterium]
MNLAINMKDIQEVIVFDTEINSATIGNFLTHIHRIIKQIDESKILIYFSSNGGSFTHADLMLNYINSMKDNIILLAFHQISSAAFKVFFEFRGQKDIMDNTFSVIHKGSKNILARDLDNTDSFDFFMTNKMMPVMNKQVIKLYKSIGLSKTELKKIDNGKDLMLHTERLCKILRKNKYEKN